MNKPPKKPTFKKSAFSVPKLKNDVRSDGDNKKVLQDSNTSNKLKEKQEIKVTEAGDNNTITSDIKKNNGLGTEKNLKSKRSLFQAPVTGDSQKQGEVSDQKKKAKKTKNTNGDDCSTATEPNKPKKKKAQDSSGGNCSTEIKKPKKKKISEENGTESSEPKRHKKEMKNEEKETDIAPKIKGLPDTAVPLEIVKIGESSSDQGKQLDLVNSGEKEESSEVDTSTDDDNLVMDITNDSIADENLDKSISEDLEERLSIEEEIKHYLDDKISPEGEEDTDIIEKRLDKSHLKMDTVCKNPPRSLTEEEYANIFQAVIDRCNSTSLEEMYESLNKPVKLKEKPEKKSKAKQQKKEKPDKEVKEPKQKPQKKLKKSKEEQVVPSQSETSVAGPSNIEETPERSDYESDKDDTDVGIEPMQEKHKDEEENGEKEEGVEDESDSEENEIEEEVQAISHLIPDEVILDLPGVSNAVEPNYQDVNENTPEGSEVEYQVPVQKTPPPKKTKKIENNSSNKTHKLAPKQLVFPKGYIEDNYGKSKPLDNKKSSKKKLHMGDSSQRNAKEMTNHKKHTAHLKTKEDHSDKADVPIVKEKSRRKELQERLLNREKLGTWVQCSKKTCSKWRFLSDCEDPSTLPEVWTCDMNIDERYNSCSKAEQNYDEAEHIFTDFAEGSVVWAKMAGFPWWPAMVEIDPDTESYFLLMTEYSMYPSHYHVVFFDDKVSRAWVNSASIRKFNGCDEDDTLKPTKSSKGFASFTKDLYLAKTNALLAYDMSVQDRLNNFSFAKRYRGKYGKPYSDSPNDIPKQKEKMSAGNRKMNTVESEMIEIALEDDDNEDAVLKGFEGVLDAIDGEIDEEGDGDYVAEKEGYDDFEMSDDGEEELRNKEIEKKTRRSVKQTQQRHKKKKEQMNRGKRLETKKPKMFIINENDDEMIVPSTPLKSHIEENTGSTSTPIKNEEMIVPTNSVKQLKLDNDIFTMDLNHSLADELSSDNSDNKSNCNGDENIEQIKKETELLVEPVCKQESIENVNDLDFFEKCISRIESSFDDTNVQSTESSSNKNNKGKQETLSSDGLSENKNDNISDVNKSSEQSTETSDKNDQKNSAGSTSQGTEDDVIDDNICSSLEQDEQMVPGEESSPDLTFDLEISNPIENKHPNQLVNHIVTPATVELAYDSDPFDMEE